MAAGLTEPIWTIDSGCGVIVPDATVGGCRVSVFIVPAEDRGVTAASAAACVSVGVTVGFDVSEGCSVAVEVGTAVDTLRAGEEKAQAERREALRITSRAGGVSFVILASGRW
jgi:hypothetical protein